jgi:DNA repair exonuclease SbcCD nuclease subunit
MKIVVFSDLHAHPFKPYATVLENGMNSRLADAIGCIEQIHEYVKANDIELVLFGGDMFHVRRTINVMAFNAVYEAMAQLRMSGVPVVLIHGNHDQADRHGEEHSIHAFRTFSTVVDKPGWQVVAGKSGDPLALMAVPYTENVEHLRSVVKEACPADQVPRILLGHLGIQGAVVGSDFVYTNPHDATIADLHLDRYDAAFLGHYHQHQQLADNCWYVGAPLQHNWGDRNQWRGFVEYDTDTGEIKQHSLEAPRFVQVPIADLEGGSAAGAEMLCKGNFVRIVDAMPWDEAKRSSTRTQLGARSLEVIPPKNGVQPSSGEGPRLEMTPGMSFQDMLRTYVHAGVQHADGLDTDYLIQLGAEVLEEIGGEQ